MLDKTHDAISNSFYWSVAWADHFFMSEDDEYEVNQSFFRVIGTYNWVDREGFQFRPQLRMRVRLKALQRRLSLIAFGDNDNEASPDISINKRAETTPVRRDPSQLNRDEARNRVGFRFNFLEWVNSRFDADVVVSSHLFPEPSIRGRQYLYKSDRTRSRFTVTGFYKEDLKFGQTTRLDYERQFAKRWSYDAAATGRNSERLPDIEWDTSANLNYLLSVREAMALRFQAVGPTRPHFISTNYRTSVMYRRNFYRTWLFYEVEPGLDWPLVDGHRRPVWSSAFRLELQFKSR